MNTKIKKYLPLCVLLAATMFFTSFSYADDETRKEAIQQHLSSITFTDNTLDQYAMEYTVSAKKNVYTVNKAGNGVYFTDGSISGVSGFAQDISKVEFYSTGLYFISFDDLVINGKKYWISLKFDYDLPYSIETSTYNDLESAYDTFLQTFSQDKTEENLRFCAEKYLSKFTIGPETKKTINNHHGSFIQPAKNESVSSVYSFSEYGPYLNVSSSSPTADSDDLFSLKFSEQVVAAKFCNSYIGNTDYWIICNYQKKANKASTPTEVEHALDMIEIVFEQEDARDNGATEEEIQEIGITTIDQSYDTSSVSSGRTQKKITYKQETLSPLSGDPLQIATKDIISNLNSDSDLSSLKSLAADFYSLVKTSASVAFVISFMLGMALLAIYGAKAKDAVATSIFYKSIILVIIVSFVSLTSMIIPVILSIAEM